MKVKTVLISWHGREPVYSVDFHPTSGRLATGGADNCVNIWQIERKGEGEVQVEFLANLTRHQKSVNAVRFSPNGEYLATASDDGTVLLWQYGGEGAAAPAFGEESEIENKETWNNVRLLRGASDIYDLCWSPCSSFLATGSTDNNAFVWDVTGRFMQKFSDHAHYVQGVAWDPRGRFLATQSSDRTVRVYKAARSLPKKEQEDNNTATVTSTPPANTTPAKTVYSKLITANVISSMESKSSAESVPAHKQKLFLDETTPSFFRRLAWSLDGSLLVTPMGQFFPSMDAAQPTVSADKENIPEHLPSNCIYLFTRGILSRPVMCLPCGAKPAVAVRFSPQLYKLKQTQEPPVLKLGYRMVFAVVTFDSLFIYDTQHMYPLCYASGLHYAQHTDIAWSSDGTMLALSSVDGYVTLVTFSADELGETLSAEDRQSLLKKNSTQ